MWDQPSQTDPGLTWPRSGAIKLRTCLERRCSARWAPSHSEFWHLIKFLQMKRERSGRARTVPSGLGSLESPGLGPCEEQSLESELRPAQAGSAVTGSGGQAPAPVTGALLLPPPAPSCHNTVSVSTSSHSLTPSTLKKTVNLLSPDVLTNWYANRKKESVYGPRRNSISNLFFQPDKKFHSGHYEQRSGDKLRKSMWNLEALLSMEGEPSNHGSGKGIKRSESAGAKFAKEVANSFIHSSSNFYPFFHTYLALTIKLTNTIAWTFIVNWTHWEAYLCFIFVVNDTLWVWGGILFGDRESGVICKVVGYLSWVSWVI